MKSSNSSEATSRRKKIFTTILSIGLVIGIVTSASLSSISLFQLNNSDLIKDAKAISNSGIQRGGRIGVVYSTPHKEVTMVAKDATIEVKPGLRVGVWTFNGTVPGPTLRFTEGDNVTIHFINKTPVPHTLHLHGDHNASADGVFETILPNQTYTYNFIAGPAGAFPYHCHALPTAQHMRMGMYGLMIIDPKDSSILKPAREYGIVMGEYDKNWTNIEAQYYLNNGYFDQYMGNDSLGVRQNELVRLYVVNMGTALVYPFHIHGTVFKAYPSGLISNKPEDRQTVLIGPGDATIIEAKWQYPGSFLFHAHGIEEEKGDMGCFYVIPSGSLAGKASPGNHICSWQNSTSLNIKTTPTLTPITNKSISMIDWQYQLQKKLQKPILVTASQENEQAATMSSMNMHTNNINKKNLPAQQMPSSSISTIDIPVGAATPKNGQYFTPENTQVPTNSKITWNNKDTIPHTATADDNSFDTDLINPGSSSGPVTLSGSIGNRITYHCALHPWMKASITLSSSTAVGGGVAGKVQQQNIRPSLAAAGPQQQTMPIHSKVIKVLPKSTSTTLGIESKNKDNWITANHDIYGTRSSKQTIIGKNNVNKLQVKWIFHSNFPIEVPPVIVGDRGYTIDNGMRIMAFDVNTGLNIWKYDPGASRLRVVGQTAHGITYDNGIIFAGTGGNATVVALNATNGKLLWQSVPVGDPTKGYRAPGPPTVWKDIVIEGNALGDNPPFPALHGVITAFNRTNGEKIWNLTTTIGSWVQGKNATINGGASTWSGGALDPKTGIFYIPTGNSSPDFNDTSRPGPNPYSSSMLAVDAKTGHILWVKQLVKHNTHDWDGGLGSSLATLTMSNGTKGAKTVIVHGTKRGDAYAIDAANGKVIWNDTVAVQHNTEVQAKPNGTGPVWPGPGGGVLGYTANDNHTAYFAVTNMAYNFFSLEGG
ncbi:MAG TPA: multicopper oxidase domain-containing protein, partial [Nitrososphaeraceae archaeon]|nr:multicopper oxidase domain-containing protein [Nitrososphaeraceae archaeon]